MGHEKKNMIIAVHEQLKIPVFFTPITSAYFLCLKLKFDIIFYKVPFKELSYKLDTNSTHYCTDVARNIQINKSFTLITML